jgi:glycosyltransferase involved in cell wall biosynthesis
MKNLLDFTNSDNSLKNELQTNLDILKKHKHNLKKQFVLITNAKAYNFWQNVNSIKKSLFNLGYITDLLPFEYKYNIKKFIQKFGISQKNEVKKFSIYNKHRSYTKSYTAKDKERTIINDSVSVVIPTYNAGPTFDIVLKKIVNQKNVKNLEIIIIDSGSQDNTLKIATKYDAKIVKINKNTFSHSTARNLGASKASGKYLIFTVQDAFMLNNITINDTINYLKINKIKAASAKQTPRFDADVFACWQIYNFSHMISPNSSDQVIKIEPSVFKKMKSNIKRAYCTIDDVYAVFEKELFINSNGYNEKYTYGEDLELGKRLIEGGHRLGYIYSNGVIHSHNRSADQLLKRYYVDNIFLNKVFNEKVNYHHSKVDIYTIIYNLLKAGKEIENKINSGNYSNPFLILTNSNHKLLNYTFSSVRLLSDLLNNNTGKLNTDLYLSLHKNFDSFILNILTDINSRWKISLLEPKQQYILVDKLFALFASNHLSQYYLSQDKINDNINGVNLFLKNNI